MINIGQAGGGENDPMKSTRTLFALFSGLAIFTALYYGRLYNFLFFHTIAELFCVVIACGMFMVIWNGRRYINNTYLLVIGIAYPFIAILDLAHMLSYKGMAILPSGDGNIPTQLWIAARYMESLTLLSAPLVTRRLIHLPRYFAGFALITGLIIADIFFGHYFPDCFVSAKGGLTPFKIYSEYVICLFLAVAVLVTFIRRSRFDPGVFRWIIASILITIMAELAFTTYISVYGFANLLGHYLKILSFYCVYKAVIETGLSKPYQLLFHDLKQSRDRYEALFSNMVNGFANHQIVSDNQGNPVDYVFLETNRAFEKLTGLTDVVGKKVTQVIPGIDNDPADWIATYGKVAMSRVPVQYENYSQALERWYSVSVYSPAKGQFATLFEDITTIKQARDSLEKSQRRFRLLSETLGHLLAANLSSELLTKLCQKVMAHIDGDVFLNYLVDESGKNLVLNRYSGIPEKESEKVQYLEFGKMVCGMAAKERRCILEKNILNKDNDETDFLRSCGIKSFYCHPLMVEDAFIGTLSFGTRKKDVFTRDDITVMETFSGYIAEAIHRRQTREKLERTNRDLEIRVAERTRELENTILSLKAQNELRKDTEKKLTRANRKLEIRAEQLRALTGQLTMVEQKERKHLAKVLHDGLQQHLVTVKFQISGLGRQFNNEELKTRLDAIESMLGECIAMSRSLSADLSPPVLYRSGLAAALKWLGKWMKQKYDFDIDLSLKIDPRLPQDVSVLIFESVRELVFNAFKHAGVAGAQILLLSSEPGWLTLQVQDSGVGFDPVSIYTPSGLGTGLGLFSIRERIALIGGIFEIDSAPGKGSCFILSVPHESESTDGADSNQLNLQGSYNGL